MSGQFIIVRADALQDPEIVKAPTVFMTLCAISTMTSQNTGWCFFKQETIAKRLGKSRQAVSKSLNRLKELGYIEVQIQNYKGRQSNNLYRLIYDEPLSTVQRDVAPMPQCDVAPSAQRDVAPKRPEYIKDKKIKKALTRNEFMREVDKSYQSNAFDEFEHLTESEIKIQAEACLDYWGSKGEWPTGEPLYVLRSWIRNGISIGKIRKPTKPKDGIAGQGARDVDYPNPIQPWQERLKSQTDTGTFASYIRPLWHDGNGSLCAPSAFMADRVKSHYMDLINRELKGVSPIFKPYPQPQKELQNA